MIWIVTGSVGNSARVIADSSSPDYRTGLDPGLHLLDYPDYRTQSAAKLTKDFPPFAYVTQFDYPQDIQSAVRKKNEGLYLRACV